MSKLKLTAKRQFQTGVVLVEFALYLELLLFVMAIVLQVGRTALMYHTVVSANHSAVFYLVTAPDSEIASYSQAKARANLIATKIAKGSAMSMPSGPLPLNFSCSPSNLRAPCNGGSAASTVTGYLSNDLWDTLLGMYTFQDGINILKLTSSSTVVMTRIGFM